MRNGKRLNGNKVKIYLQWLIEWVLVLANKERGVFPVSSAVCLSLARKSHVDGCNARAPVKAVWNMERTREKADFAFLYGVSSPEETVLGSDSCVYSCAVKRQRGMWGLGRHHLSLDLEVP